VKTVLEHPAPFLRGFALRAAYVLGLKLWLFALAGLGLFLRRRDPGARALAVQCAYFAALVCAMPVEADYFQPLWPLLLALAAAPLARLEPPPADWAFDLASAGGVAMAAVLAGAIAARSGVLALSYAARAARRAPWSDAALDEALARRPPEAWAALGEARRRLRAADLPRARLLLAWARAKTGDSASLFALVAKDESPYNDDLRVKLPLYQALA